MTQPWGRGRLARCSHHHLITLNMQAAPQERAGETPAPPGPDIAAPPGKLRAWLMAMRPRTLPAAASPVIVGTACAHADDVLDWPAAILALVGALLIQVGTNLANDYYDHKKGADTADRIGPTRVTQAGLIAPAQVRLSFITAFALAFAVGIYLIIVGGWIVLAIGIASIISGWAYTGGPYPLGYHGLGDVFAFVFFGPVAVIGTWFVQAQAHAPQWTGELLALPPLSSTPTLLVILASIPLGLLTAAILMVNNYRDVDTDRIAGKRTIAVRFGRRTMRALYSAMLATSIAMPIALFAIDSTNPWVLLACAAVVPAIPPWRAMMTKTEGPPLNQALGSTARLLLIYSMLLGAGIAIG